MGRAGGMWTSHCAIVSIKLNVLFPNLTFSYHLSLLLNSYVLSNTHPPNTTAWSIKYQACWCNFLTTDQLCKEPCVKEEYIDFSTVPFSNFDYCDKSVCDKDWHHSKSYCEDDIKFDGEECDATIDALLYTTGGSLDVYDDEVYDDDDAQEDHHGHSNRPPHG